MSLSMTLVHELASQAPTQIAAAAPMAGGDIFSKLNGITSSATGTAKLGGGLLGVLMILITAWRVRGAIAGVIAGFIGAAVFVWAVNNVGSSDISQPITDTIKGAPAVPSPAVPGQPTRPAPGIVNAEGSPASIPSSLSGAV